MTNHNVACPRCGNQATYAMTGKENHTYHSAGNTVMRMRRCGGRPNSMIQKGCGYRFTTYESPHPPLLTGDMGNIIHDQLGHAILNFTEGAKILKEVAQSIPKSQTARRRRKT